jgi:lipopolysaccharide transport system permease protein
MGMGWLSTVVLPYLPRVVFQRDQTGRVLAVRVKMGTTPAPEGGGHADLDTWLIEPVGSGIFSKIEEFWRYRRILKYLAVQSVQRLYVGMNLGILWLFLRPLLPIFISTLIFGSLLNVPSGNVPYFLFFLTGTMNWMLFERSLLWVTRSLEQQRGMIRKMYFPRLLVPVSSVAPAIVDLLIYAGLLLGTILYYWFREGHWYLRVGPSLLLALFAAFLSTLLAIAVGLWTSVWQVYAREVRYTLRYVVRFWNYLTPVLYPLSQVPPEYRWIMFVNPMAPIVEAFKWSVIGEGELHWPALGSAMAVTLVLLMAGTWYFSNAEAATVDN